MSNLRENDKFIELSKMSNIDRGQLITSHKPDLENYFNHDLIIHKYGSQPRNENEMLSFNQHNELVNIVEFVPR